MRPDQRKMLVDLSEKLTDAVLLDADPDNWAGAGKTSAEMSQEERGDAVWCRKLAVQSLTVLGRVQHILQNERDGKSAGNEVSEPDAEIQEAEREAKSLLNRVLNEAKHGKRQHAKH